MFSIDQNCHSLWDVLPKLEALRRRGHAVRHFIEDIDVAFTSLGSGLQTPGLRIARERFHHSGGADWGAALFYSEFLGRLPIDVRDWETITGVRTNALAKRLDRSAEDLFDEFSPGDNWQLIGASYVGDRNHHRVISDLSVAEVGPFLREIMQKAKADMLRTFPRADSRARLLEWFAREESLLALLLERYARGSLPDLYRAWLGEYLGETVRLDTTSRLFAPGAHPACAAMLEVFLKDYDLAAGLYNESIAESASKLRPLRTRQGELPFFAVLTHQGRLARTGVSLQADELIIGERSFRLSPGSSAPLEAMKAAGVLALAGKAVVLVMQACLRPSGAPLAMPYRGSPYVPASRGLARKLAAEGMLPGELHPIVRVRFHLLDRLRGVETPIRLPEHLADCFGDSEIPARRLGENYASLAEEAAGRLEALADPNRRERRQEQSFPALTAEIAKLEARKRELAKSAAKGRQIRDLWKQIKALQVELLGRTVRQIARDVQVRDLDYWDSRGALLPWSIALGGESFYDELINHAEIYEEPFCDPGRSGDATAP